MTELTRSTHTIHPHDTRPDELPQYSVPRILGTWAAAAIPMAALAWGVAPRLADAFSGPTAVSRALILCLAAGMVWQFLLVLILVRQEQGSLRWPVLKAALWLRAPDSTRTGKRGGRLWWVVLPMVLALGAEEALPKLPTPATRDLGLFLGSHTGQDFMSGNWLWLVILVASFVFNTVLGEELLFRGLLLPRMRGAFGRWDWAANGVLFALYHLHVPWVIPQTLLVDTFAVGYPARRYRSAVIGIIAHSAQSVFFTVLLVGLVLK
jgi:membrane protease YdiL (CAAX protease family)